MEKETKNVMRSSSLSSFLFLLFVHLVSSQTVQQLFPLPRCSNNFTSKSAYQSELDTLFSSITPKNSINYGFFNASTSTKQNSDTPNVIGLCRGDLGAEACRACLSTSADELGQLCPNKKQAIVYNENCTLRYSNHTLLGQVVTNLEYSYLLNNVKNASNPDSFNQSLRELFVSLQTEAATGGSLHKFAAGNTLADFDTIFASAQCTPDLSDEQCTDCLDIVYSRVPQCCLDKIGGILMSPSCSFRYEVYPFLDVVGPPPSPPPRASAPSSPPTTPAASTSPPGSKSNTAKTIIIIVVPAIIAIILIIFIVVLKMKSKKKPLLVEKGVDDIFDVEYVQFDLATIEVATNNFSENNKLGQGGFGAVYKGILSNGQQIAVKRLSGNSSQGESEFKNEVMLLIKLQHRNLVRLQGFCLEGNEKLLIYEFLENSSLDHFIFNLNKRELLDWDTRHKIIIGIARGLLYLHEDSRLRIIHRDLKASNILLDTEMNPKISDFGLAKLFVLDQTQADTSRIVGTYGYMAPEYAMHGNFSIKSDVFSFGVLVLEIASGQKNDCFREGEYVENLLSYVWKNWREGTLANVIDPTLKGGSRVEMARCIHIGLLCVQENIPSRPTMASVVLMLNSNSITLALPSQPAFLAYSNISLDISSTQEHTSKGSEVDQSKNKIGSISKNNVSITELYPR